MTRILVVRMSALGDIVHALPVLAAIRATYPAVEIDWLADRKYAGILDLVDGISLRIIGRPG
ncbi:MAG: glycosyltransferase family 9 protein, partial [Acidobacteria bacterium]|nr:glycosyltransferase family 9 protein [Acidobacteriota bacterium]